MSKTMTGKDYYRASDFFGRIWEVKKSAVREDYIQMLIDLDGLTYEEAAKTPQANEDLDYWWREQIMDDFGHVKSIGTLVQDIPQWRKERVLDSIAYRHVMTDVTDE